jgi:hypothetical protein
MAMLLSQEGAKAIAVCSQPLLLRWLLVVMELVSLLQKKTVTQCQPAIMRPIGKVMLAGAALIESEFLTWYPQTSFRKCGSTISN